MCTEFTGCTRIGSVGCKTTSDLSVLVFLLDFIGPHVSRSKNQFTIIIN